MRNGSQTHGLVLDCRFLRLHRVINYLLKPIEETTMRSLVTPRVMSQSCLQCCQCSLRFRDSLGCPDWLRLLKSWWSEHILVALCILYWVFLEVLRWDRDRVVHAVRRSSRRLKCCLLLGTQAALLGIRCTCRVL